MKAKRRTDVIITVPHDEVHLLRNALRSFVHNIPTSSYDIDDLDQHGKIVELIDLLTEEE